MTTHPYVLDADNLPARSSTEVHEKWGNVVHEVWSKGSASSQVMVTLI